MKIVVAIPVYRKEMTKEEEISLKQCLSILFDYNICLVCPDSLDISGYTNHFHSFGKELKIKTFSPKYFESVKSYNRLMLNKEFYSAFQEYNYMLIYQLDCYVFFDELYYWCEQNYDYIGSPFHVDGSANITADSPKLLIGNGGLSLRKISSFLKIFDIQGNVFSCAEIRKMNCNSPWWKLVPLVLLSKFGYRNTIKYYTKEYKQNEDAFFALLGDQGKYDFKTPDFFTALRFAIEKNPSELYSLNQNRLPFGCHGWRKNDYRLFWSQFINY
jgi:hypothetical protein